MPISASKTCGWQCQKLLTDRKELAWSYASMLLLTWALYSQDSEEWLVWSSSDRRWAGEKVWRLTDSSSFWSYCHEGEQWERSGIHEEKVTLKAYLPVWIINMCQGRIFSFKTSLFVCVHVSPRLCLRPVCREAERSRPAPALGSGRDTQSC